MRANGVRIFPWMGNDLWFEYMAIHYRGGASFGCQCCGTVRACLESHFMSDELEDMVGFEVRP